MADFSMHVVNPIAAGNVPAASATPATNTDSSSGTHHGFSFHDFLDIINPLQHIPIVSTLYRKITGDEIGTPEKVIGDTLFGGFGGLVSSLADGVFEKITGKNMGDTVLAMLDGGDKAAAVADNTKAAAPTTKIALNPVAIPPLPDLNVATDAPTQLASTNTGVADDAAAMAFTAALNRAQLDPAMAAQARYAYNRAIDLTQPKLPDAAAFAY